MTPEEHRASMDRIARVLKEFIRVADAANARGTKKLEFDAAILKLQYHVQDYD